MSPLRYLNGPLKRTVGLALAATMLVALLPLLPVAAIVVRFGSPGPTFYRQLRTGRNGVPFEVIKLRTMTVGTVPVVGDETHADDPRITPAGRWLRRTGIDELPQLWNVVRGDMCLVGPRPLLAWENDQCTPRQRRRLLARPGITGLSQVMGRNRLEWADRIAWDVRYVAHASPTLDLWILWRTLGVALLGRDAYHAGNDGRWMRPRPQRT